MARHTLICILITITTTMTDTSTNTTSPVNTTSVPTITKLPTLIPDTFYYDMFSRQPVKFYFEDCTEEGEIMNEEESLSNVKNLNQSSSNCSDPTTEEDGSITIAKCKMNTTVTFVLEAINKTGILGGRHSKTFQIKCEDVNIQPYLLNVTATEIVGNQDTPHVITIATEPSPSSISSLIMTIKDNKTKVDEASIGQALTVAIAIPGKTTIKPTECKASANGKSVTLWQETGCKHDDELFGEKWGNESGEVINTMYGFRFVGSSKLITVTCTVRVCPDEYRGTDCDLTTCGSRKRKRSTRLSETVTIQKATTSLTIRDPLMTSRAGRLGYELKTIIGLALASVGFVKIKFLQ